MREVTIKLYELDELSPDARDHAIKTLREKLGGEWWDSPDNDDVRDVMTATLAEKLGTPGVHDYGVSDFPGIDGVTIEGWSLDQHQSLAVSGTLDRNNAPGLPWLDGLDHVELKGVRSCSTSVRVRVVEPECTCPAVDWVEALLAPHEDGCPHLAEPRVTNEQLGALEQAVRDALSEAWSAGEKEAEYKVSEESAIAAAEGREFTEDGELA